MRRALDRLLCAFGLHDWALIKNETSRSRGPAADVVACRCGTGENDGCDVAIVLRNSPSRLSVYIFCRELNPMHWR